MLSNKQNRLWVLLALLVASCFTAIACGAVSIDGKDMVRALEHLLRGEPLQGIHEHVFIQLRLPRVLLVLVSGMVLAASGVLMQALFRNPIIEPGLVGTSAGAAFGASLVFVSGDLIGSGIRNATGPLLVPFFAFAGAMIATIIAYSLAKNARYISVVSLLLIGIAINAVGLSATGFMSYIARDPQARSITFWTLGTFSGASWAQVTIVSITAIAGLAYASGLTRQLNVLILGEEDAVYTGIDLEKLKRRLLLVNTLMVAVVTAFAGVISFVGLIVPHIMRLYVGSNNKWLLPASMLGGGILLVLSDLASRLLFAPAEIPIGIITSLIGAPVFIILLRKLKLLNG